MENKNVKDLRKYGKQLAERMGIKYDWSKIKDENLLELVIILKSEHKGL